MAKKKVSEALLEIAETTEARAVKMAREYSKLGKRIRSVRAALESLEAKRAAIEDEWDELAQRDAKMCEEINAADA